MQLFKAQRVKRTAVLNLHGNIDDVFTLFDPVNEKKWEPDWQIEPLFPPSGEVSERFVFKTEAPGEPDAIWCLNKLDPVSHRIEYLKFEPGFKLVHIDIQCEEVSRGVTQATVSYTQTALAEKGNAFIATFTEAYFQRWLKTWENKINAFLQESGT